MMELMWSTPVKKLAEEKVIPQYHAELAGAQIAYLLADKISPKGGRDVLAKIRKATATEKAIADLNLVLTINEEQWHSHGEAWQVALLDHEFCHVLVEFTAEGDIQKYTIVAHDLEEFGVIVERHGAWTEDIEEFGRVIQKSLFSGK